MRGIIAVCVVVLLGSLLPERVAAAITPVPTISAVDYTALQSLNNLTVDYTSVSLDDALGSASFVGAYDLRHGVSEYYSGVTTNDAVLPTYPLTTDVTACSSYSGDTPGVGGGGGGGSYGVNSTVTTPYTWQQYLNACTMGGPACAAAFQQKVTISLGYWVGAGASVSVPMVTFTGAPVGAPAPPAAYRSSAPIWGVSLFIDPTSARPRVTGGVIPTFAPTSIPSIWDSLGGILTPPEIGRVFGDGVGRITSAMVAIGYVKKIRLDVLIPALLQNVLRPTIQVCDYIPQDVSDPTVVARASATIAATAIPATTPVNSALSYFNLGTNWQKVHNGLVLGYRLHCSAINRAYCVVQIKSPLSGYISWKFERGVLPAGAYLGYGMGASCGSLDGGCYYSWSALGASATEDVFIYCTVLDYSASTGRICPLDVWLSSAVQVVSSISCPCVNFAATRTAGVGVTPTITVRPVIPTYQVVATATPLVQVVTNTPVATAAVADGAATKTVKAIISNNQTATMVSRYLTATAYVANTNNTTVARTSTAAAYINYNGTATALVQFQAGTATARIAQTAVAAATATQSLYLAQTAQAAGTAQAQITATRAVLIDNGNATDGRDPAIVYQVTDKLTSSMSVFGALSSLKSLGLAFTDGLVSTPCNGLPSSIDGASLSGGWSLSGMAPALCAVRVWLAAQTTALPYVRVLISALMVLFMLRVVMRFFMHQSSNKRS